MIDVGDYLELLRREYLGDYVAGGGAAVKFVVGADDEATEAYLAGVRAAAGGAGYVVATVDAAVTRVHLFEQIFFEVARQVGWEDLARTAASAALVAAGYPPPEGRDLSLDQVAAHHRVEARELRRDVDRELQQRVHRDYAMVAELRTAMLRLCQAQLRTGQVADAEHTAILEWLHGELRQISALKSALIFRRIGRHNARALLFSLAHWLASQGHAGLVVIVDIRRFGFARRPDPAERQGHYYTKAALLDAYEVFRQLVDNTDEAAHCFVSVVAAPAFLTDANRGLDAYQALKLRIFDEIRDRRRDNPLSSLVRLGSA